MIQPVTVRHWMTHSHNTACDCLSLNDTLSWYSLWPSVIARRCGRRPCR